MGVIEDGIEQHAKQRGKSIGDRKKRKVYPSPMKPGSQPVLAAGSKAAGR